MAMRRISFTRIIPALVLVVAWTVWNCTRPRTELRPVFASAGTGTISARGPDDEKDVLKQGRELFTREWIAGDHRSHAGDGLGPVYNAQSCAACHRLGGIGGAGSNETNVSLVTVFVSQKHTGALFGSLLSHPLPPARAPKKFAITPGREIELDVPSQEELAKIHPVLLTQPSFPFHRLGAGPEFARWQASIFPKDRTEIDRFNKHGANRRCTNVTGSGMLTLIESKRSTPPLFGAGLIDAIPDRVLEEVAAEQAKASADAPDTSELRQRCEALPVRGRVARQKGGRAGRFGWKASVATLREFTLQACSNELGLEVPGFARAVPAWRGDDKAKGIDLTAVQCDALTGFVASLPRPGVRPADSTDEAGQIERGRRLFASVGCAVCHRPQLGVVEGIYSDLLLHDMGHELSDSGSYTVLEPELASKDKPLPPRAANSQEWRTPPLWGLRDSAPYMHDGRAATVADAVALHGGEGESAAQGYKRLSVKERAQIELFLKTLAAPTMARGVLHTSTPLDPITDEEQLIAERPVPRRIAESGPVQAIAPSSAKDGGGVGSSTGPDGGSSEKPNPPEPIAKAPRPTPRDGKEIKMRRYAPKELLIKFAVDEQGLATDEQVESQLKIFSMSEFSGWNQSDGWSAKVAVDQIEALKALGLDQAQLKKPSGGYGGRINWKSWQISPSHRLKLTYDYALRGDTWISFPKAN